MTADHDPHDLADIRNDLRELRHGQRQLQALVRKLAADESATEALLSLKQAAARAGTSDRTLSRAIKDGELKAARIGRGRQRYRIKPADLESWLEGRAAT